MIKSGTKDAKVISSPDTIVSKPDTIISGFEIGNRCGNESLYILTKKIFFPTRWQNISSKNA